MRLGFILPNDCDLVKISEAQTAIYAMRQDQRDYAIHLLRSWRVFGRQDGVALVWRAIKRTWRERP